MKSKLVSLVCSGCGITFQVIPCQKGRKFCSHECYLKHIPKGKDWKGGTLRGKGSRGPYSESSVKQRAEAKVKKHIKILDESVDIEKLKYIVSLKYCNSIKMLFRYAAKKDLGRCRTFNSYLKYYNLYEDVLNTPCYYEAIRKAPPEEFLWLLKLLKECKSWLELSSRFYFEKKENNYKMSGRVLSYKNLYPLIKDFKIDCYCFDKLGNKKYSNCGTSIEIVIRNVLDKVNLSYVEQYKIESKEYKQNNENAYRKSFYKADFFVENCLVIEVNGDYWHGYSGGTEEWCQSRRKVDEEKYRTYESLKIPYLVIWEHEINELPIQEIENRILLGVINARKKWNN